MLQFLILCLKKFNMAQFCCQFQQWIIVLFIQAPCVLNSVVLFDTLSLDFEISEAVMIAYGGQVRSLTSAATPKEGVAWQLNQHMTPSDKLRIKVEFIVMSFVYYCLACVVRCKMSSILQYNTLALLVPLWLVPKFEWWHCLCPHAVKWQLHVHWALFISYMYVHVAIVAAQHTTMHN